MKLFAKCPYCTIDIWGWQRTCAACETDSCSSLGPETLEQADAANGPSGIRQILVSLAVAARFVAPGQPRTL